MTIAIIAAMAQEIGPFRDSTVQLHRTELGKVVIEEASYGDQKLLLVETGIGKVNAAIAATLLIERHHPELIINIGSAGAFDDSLKAGDVIVATEYKYGDVDATCFGYAKGQVPRMPASYPLADNWLKLVHETITKHKDSLQYAVGHGLVLTLDSFMSSQQRANQVVYDFPEVKVSDMEGLAIIQAAAPYNIPVIAIKAVSDKAGDEDGAANSFNENLQLAAETSSDFAKRLLGQLLK